MITRAERRINTGAAEIENLIRRKRNEKTAFERWLDYVKDYIYSIALNVQNKLKEKGKEKQASIDDTIQTDTFSPSTSATKPPANDEELPLRSFSCSLTPLLRSDLPTDIKQGILDGIRDTLVFATDFIYEHGR